MLATISAATGDVERALSLASEVMVSSVKWTLPANTIKMFASISGVMLLGSVCCPKAVMRDCTCAFIFFFFDAKVGEQRGSRKDNVRARVRTFLLYLIRPGEGVGDDALKFLPDVLTKEIA